MKERPILFNAPMVRALLDGSKTQTRRAAKLTDAGHVKEVGGHRRWHPADKNAVLACPYGQPGDRLWVRESFQYRGASYDGDGIEESEWFRCYGSGGAIDNWDPQYPQGWEPSRHMNARKMTEPIEQEDDGVTGWLTKRIPAIHMPRWASRITLEVTGVRVERLQDISAADALDEGIKITVDAETKEPLVRISGKFPSAQYVKGNGIVIAEYASLWEQINGPGSWVANPWIWVIEFKRSTQ